MTAIKEIKQFKRVFACNNRKFTTDDIYKFVRHKSLWGSIHKQASFPKRTIKKKSSVCSLSAEWWMIIISCEQRLHFHSVGKVPRSTFCKLANHKVFFKAKYFEKIQETPSVFWSKRHELTLHFLPYLTYCMLQLCVKIFHVNW